MPKRSTPFQQLVLHLQRVLSPGCTVEESAMLLHRVTQSLREVDVVVRSLVGEHSVVISIECIDHARPADVVWVEQMVAKHAELPTSRLVLVSRSGFTAAAMSLASGKGVDAYTPESAADAPWTEIVEKQSRLWIAGYNFTPTSCALRVGEVWSDAGFDTVIEDSLGQRMSLNDVVMFIIRSHELFAGEAMGKVTRDGESKLTIEFEPNPHPVAFDTAGKPHPVAKIRVQLDVVRRTDSVEVSSLAWHGLPAAIATGQTSLGEAALTVVEAKPGEMDATARFDGKDATMYRFGAKRS